MEMTRVDAIFRLVSWFLIGSVCAILLVMWFFGTENTATEFEALVGTRVNVVMVDVCRAYFPVNAQDAEELYVFGVNRGWANDFLTIFHEDLPDFDDFSLLLAGSGHVIMGSSGYFLSVMRRLW